MPQPPQYTRITSFSADEANNLAGRSTVRTVNLNTEFDNAKLTLDQLVTNSGLIQRDDGKLLDGVVSQASLSSAVTALFISIGANPRGAWLTATVYAFRDIIETGAPVAPYMCVTAHTSGVFATDYAAGRWVVLGSSLPNASQVTLTPTGDVAATNVQSGIAELSTEKVAKASNGSDFANIATTRDNLSVFSRAESQSFTYLTAIATGTFDAITASFTPAMTTLINQQIVFVRAIGANTVTNPTFTPNSGVVAVKTIKKLNNIALDIGDIYGSSHVLILQYNSIVDSWFLLNPSSINHTIAETHTGAETHSGIETHSGAEVFSNQINLTGGQIRFPATKIDSSDPNTLDDYEEGTWTPSLGGTTTYTAREGSYVKIGRIVYLRGTIIVNLIGTGSTTLISGIPFTVDSFDCPAACAGFISLATAVVSLFLYFQGNSTILAVQSITAASTTFGTSPIFGNSTRLNFSGVYQTVN